MLFINDSPGVWLNLPDRADLEMAVTVMNGACRAMFRRLGLEKSKRFIFLPGTFLECDRRVKVENREKRSGALMSSLHTSTSKIKLFPPKCEGTASGRV